jgi:hypothetical protein
MSFLRLAGAGGRAPATILRPAGATKDEVGNDR